MLDNRILLANLLDLESLPGTQDNQALPFTPIPVSSHPPPNQKTPNPDATTSPDLTEPVILSLVRAGGTAAQKGKKSETLLLNTNVFSFVNMLLK